MSNQELYPNIKQSFCLVFFTLILQLVVGIIIGVIGAIFKINSSTHPVIIASMNIITFGIVILFAHKKTNQDWKDTFQFLPFNFHILFPLIPCLVGFGIVLSEIDNILRFFMPSPEFINSIMSEISTSGPSSILLLCIVAPLIEEILFRGIILNGLLSRYSPIKAILISSLLFSLLHLNPYQLFPAFAIGLLLGFLYFKVRSVLLCVIAHSVSNFQVIIASIPSINIPGYSLPDSYEKVIFQPFWFDLAGLLLLFVGFWFLLKSLQSVSTHAERDVASDRS